MSEIKKEYPLPETPEELLEEISKLETIINKYNEHLLTALDDRDSVLEEIISEEEFDEVYAHYQFLKEIEEINRPILRKEKKTKKDKNKVKEEKVEEKEIEEELDSTETKTIWEIIPMWFYVLSIPALIFTYYFFVLTAGVAFTQLFAANQAVSDFIIPKSEGQKVLAISLFFLIYPLILIIITFIPRFFKLHRKFKPIYLVYQILFGVSLVVNWIFVFFNVIKA